MTPGSSGGPGFVRGEPLTKPREIVITSYRGLGVPPLSPTPLFVFFICYLFLSLLSINLSCYFFLSLMSFPFLNIRGSKKVKLSYCPLQSLGAPREESSPPARKALLFWLGG